VSGRPSTDDRHDRSAKSILVIALGGNALMRGEKGETIAEQFENLRLPIRQIAELSRDHRIIITHGNGPQVGDLLLKQEACGEGAAGSGIEACGMRYPLEILVAQTEGQIGYMIESALDGALMDLGVAHRPLVTLITYVVVRRDDPRLTSPDKPVGPVLAPRGAPRPEAPYPTRETAKGWRRVVGSPQPMSIIERREIKTLIGLDFIVICCGGGGIPVVREDRGFHGVDAVIDKDLASSLLAREVGADRLVIATDVRGAYLDYGGENERLLTRMSTEQARRLITSGAFPPGSMLPKVEACRFTAHTAKPSCICALEDIAKAALGEAGTVFVP
jgi:carbamate kinase